VEFTVGQQFLDLFFMSCGFILTI